MATHSSTLAQKIPWMEEPGGLQSMGSRRVRHDSDFTTSRCLLGQHSPSFCYLLTSSCKFFFLLSYFYFPRDDFCASFVPFLIISCSCLVYVLYYNFEDIISFFLASVSSDYKYCFCLLRAFFLFSSFLLLFFPFSFWYAELLINFLILTHNMNLVKNQQALK